MDINKYYRQLNKIKKDLSEEEIDEKIEFINNNFFLISDYNFKNFNELKNKVNANNFIKFITETDDNFMNKLQLLRENYSYNCKKILNNDIKDFYKLFPFLKLFVYNYSIHYHIIFLKNYYKYNNDIILKDNNYLKICFNLKQKESYDLKKINEKIQFLLNYNNDKNTELKCIIIIYLINEIFQNKEFLIKHKNFYNVFLNKILEFKETEIFRLYLKQINIDFNYLLKQLTDIKEEN